MKAEEKKKVILGVVAGVGVLAVAIAGICVANSRRKAAEPSETTAVTTEAITGELVVIEKITQETGTTEQATKELEKDDEMLTVKPPVTTTTQNHDDKPEKTTEVEVAVPVTTTERSGAQDGVIIGGGAEVKTYSCGVSGHHCDSPETHSFIVSLEQKGCPYCGSHSCRSFYSVDEWGNACYDATRCPEYSDKSDPLEYCQECGKKVGDGHNGTCIRYNSVTTCPDCGKQVSAKTCHSH